MAKHQLTLRMDASDLQAAIGFFMQSTACWPSEKREDLFSEILALCADGRAVDVQVLNGTAFGAASAEFLDLLKKWGLSGPEIPAGGQA